MRSALEWAQVWALAADGVSQREIARRLGISRNTLRRLVEAKEPARYQREPGVVDAPVDEGGRDHGLAEDLAQASKPRLEVTMIEPRS